MKLDKQILTLPVIAGIIALLAAGVGGYYYVKYQNAQKTLASALSDPKTAQKAAAAETAKLVAEVGKLIELPKETPTIATITDVNKLKDQPFFAKAKNGDKVLIFTNAKKVILYDTVNHKIIDVAPINIGTPSASQTQQAKIALSNGTKVSGAASKVETQITNVFPQVQIVSKTDAKGNYDKTIVVILSDGAKDAASSLAAALKVNVGNLPSGETKPTGADILVIIGADLTK